MLQRPSNKGLVAAMSLCIGRVTKGYCHRLQHVTVNTLLCMVLETRHRSHSWTYVLLPSPFPPLSPLPSHIRNHSPSRTSLLSPPRPCRAQQQSELRSQLWGSSVASPASVPCARTIQVLLFSCCRTCTFCMCVMHESMSLESVTSKHLLFHKAVSVSFGALVQPSTAHLRCRC